MMHADDPAAPHSLDFRGGHAGQIGGQGAEGARETYGRVDRPLLRPARSAPGPLAKA
jgi:hypothetical protein